MFHPQRKEGAPRHLTKTASGKPLAEDEKRARLREAGRRKLDMFKQRQLTELQRNENGRFANLLSMAAPLPMDPTSSEDGLSEQMGSPMSKHHSRRLSDWSVTSSNQAEAAPAAAAALPASSSRGRGSLDAAAAAAPAAATPPPALPKIQPKFRPIFSPAAGAAAAAKPAAPPEAEAQNAATDDSQMVQILLQQVAQLQAEKQEILRRCSALELDNANLQELVGFLSESAELDAAVDGFGSLELAEEDLDEVYTIVQGSPQPQPPLEDQQHDEQQQGEEQADEDSALAAALEFSDTVYAAKELSPGEPPPAASAVAAAEAS